MYIVPLWFLLAGDVSFAGAIFIILSVIYLFVALYAASEQKKIKAIIQDVGERRFKEVNNDLAIVKIIEQELLDIVGGSYPRVHLTPPNQNYTGKVREYWGSEKEQIKYELSFKDGQEHGKWKAWYSNGILGYEATYKVCGFLGLGKKHGNVSVFNKSGKLQASLQYREGNLVYK